MRRHRTDPFSLVFGATFALIGMTFLFAHVDLNRLHLWWVWSAPLIVLGVLIVILAARREGEQLWRPQPAAGPEPPSANEHVEDGFLASVGKVSRYGSHDAPAGDEERKDAGADRERDSRPVGEVAYRAARAGGLREASAEV